LLVEIFLKAHEDSADLFGPAEIGRGVRNGVVIFEAEERRQLLLVEFLHAFFHVVREDEIEEGLLLLVEVAVDPYLGMGRAFLASQRRQRVGDMR
jgi:hypothetical protein